MRQDLYWLHERQHGDVFNIVQTKASELTSGSASCAGRETGWRDQRSCPMSG
jgi:hypothetical protein